MASKNSPFRVKSLSISGLWGERDIDLTFHADVNVLVGPNGCGKTTVLNLIRYVLYGEVQELSELQFDKIVLGLEAFRGASKLKLEVTSQESSLVYKIAGKEYEIATDSFVQRKYVRMHPNRKRRIARVLVEDLSSIVPFVWLPITRRLPIPEDEATYFESSVREVRNRRHRLESVDQRLFELLRELSGYRAKMDAQLAKRYKEFERSVLSLILFSKEFDRQVALSEVPTEQDKQQLLKAFSDAGLLDSKMRERIDEHFEAARNAVRENRGDAVTLEELLVLPLVRRTKEMVKLASKLELQRAEIFFQLRVFERIVNEFLGGKRLSVLDDGAVRFARESKGEDCQFPPDQLSSGEKQILILLIEALLREREPVVYVVDEPELSLHIEWQEKLLQSLVDLAQQVQVIVATHSPDIVGPFREKVIEMKGSS